MFNSQIKLIIFILSILFIAFTIYGVTKFISNINTSKSIYQTLTAPNSPLIIAVGDIQCVNISTTNKCPGSKQVDEVKKLDPAAILLLGDEQYGKGTNRDLINSIGKTWGKLKKDVHSVPGNHEYLNRGALGYFQYFFGGKKGTNQDYYSFNVGNWHIIALDSNCRYVGGCDPQSPQYLWLVNDLQKNNRTCTLAFFHHPLFSSGIHGNNIFIKDFWNVLYKYHADIILNGHEHVYERFAPQTPNGKEDLSRGIRQFTVGTGGGHLYKFVNIQPNSEVRYNGDFGLLALKLQKNSYEWAYIPTNKADFSDIGAGACH